MCFGLESSFPLACRLTFEECFCRLTNNILSTAQQVWLQKYGGAKNPMEKLTNLVMKEDKTQKVEKPFSEPIVQKSVSAVKTPREKGGEKVTLEGPKPGER